MHHANVVWQPGSAETPGPFGAQGLPVTPSRGRDMMWNTERIKRRRGEWRKGRRREKKGKEKLRVQCFQRSAPIVVFRFIEVSDLDV